MSHRHHDVPLRVLGWCTGLQFVGMVLAFWGASLTTSYAVLSDGWHMAADLVPAAVTFGGRWWMQRQRADHIPHRHSLVNLIGTFNAVTLIAAGALTINETAPAIKTVHTVWFWPALGFATCSVVINWVSHRLIHRHRHDAVDNRYDLWSLDGHLIVDSIVSAAVVLFLILNRVYQASWWDLAGGMIIGWWMIGFGSWLLVRPLLHRRS